MKNLIPIISLMLLGVGSYSMNATNTPILFNYNGELLELKQLVKGEVSLFVNYYQQEVIVDTGEDFFLTETHEFERFFISDGIMLEEITAINYKKLINRYLPNSPELHKRLGKLGFRFENVLHMIRFYNKFKT